MQEISANVFRGNLKRFVDQCIVSHDPLRVRRRRGRSFVVLGEDDWRSIEETIYLERLPGMAESLKKAAREPLSKGVRLKDLKW